MRSRYHAHCLSTPSMTVSWISDITIILLKFEATVSLNIDKTLISRRIISNFGLLRISFGRTTKIVVEFQNKSSILLFH